MTTILKYTRTNKRKQTKTSVLEWNWTVTHSLLIAGSRCSSVNEVAFTVPTGVIVLNISHFKSHPCLFPI